MTFKNHFEGGEAHKIATEMEKRETVALSFQCTEVKADSFQDLSKKHQFNNLVPDLTFRLWRWFPTALKNDVNEMLTEMDSKVTSIQKTNLSEGKKQKEIIELEFKYYKTLHNINSSVLPYSTLFEQDVVGELDPTDEKAIAIIQHKAPSDLPARFRG